jgi:uncharacterized protein (TIRG00374 family)
MDIKKTFGNILKIAPPIILGSAILYWMYRDFDFSGIRHVLFHEMNWTWMILSFPFGVLAQMFRGWRWKQVLEPLDEKPRTRTSIYSIFLSYAVSLVIPRIGEVTRCGILKRYDGVSFSKAFGTVVTERAVDMLLMALITAMALLLLSQLDTIASSPHSLMIQNIFVKGKFWPKKYCFWLINHIAKRRIS